MPDTAQSNLDGTESSPTPFWKRFSKKTILIASAVLLVIVALVLYLILASGENGSSEKDLADREAARRNQANQERENREIAEKFQLSNSLVYGAWIAEKSVISAVDLTSGTSSVLAELPLNVKKVSVMAPTQIIYIDQTDDNDHGTQIASYDLSKKRTEPLVKASDGFKIDDYVLSPNKEFIAIWEVQLAPGTNVLQGGRSRVYGLKVSDPTNKYLLYDEPAISPIRYPRAVLNNGLVFMDRFMPNDPAGGAGWAYGMSVSSFNGEDKKDIEEMRNGTYGTQPSLSPDGRYLVFAGYDGRNGDGTASPYGFRQALLSPTTVELLDTETFRRIKLSNLPQQSIFTTVEWGYDSNNIIISTLSKIPENEGLFSYNIQAGSLKKLELTNAEGEPLTLVTSVSRNRLLVATTDDSASAVGNLGAGYWPSLTQVFNFDPDTNQAFKIPVRDTYSQYITTLPRNYFENVLGIAHAQEGNPEDPNVTVIDLYSDKSPEENLQLKTFLLKPNLDPVRKKQQSAPVPSPTPTTVTPIPTQKSNPTPTQFIGPTRKPFVIEKTINCRDLAREQCGRSSWNSGKCVRRKAAQLKAEGKCNQSPLYLYGAAGTNVKVQILTTVYNDSPAYKGGYDVTLLQNDGMLIGGKSYQAIDYDYQSNLRKLNPPTRGAIVKKVGIEKVLREYARRLGLNEKETKDLVEVGKTKVNSPYVFISFFDQKISEKILPISFDPQPDNYLNVVFYFKQLHEKPNYTPAPPSYPTPLKRDGLTAVEVSEIIE
jgi:hypothetical protein